MRSGIAVSIPESGSAEHVKQNAAALSLESSVAPRKVDVSGLQKRLVAQGVNLGTR